MLFSYKHNLFVPIQHFWNKSYNLAVSWQIKIQLQASFIAILQETNFKNEINFLKIRNSVSCYTFYKTLSFYTTNHHFRDCLELGHKIVLLLLNHFLLLAQAHYPDEKVAYFKKILSECITCNQESECQKIFQLFALFTLLVKIK